MSTPNLVPRVDGEGSLGREDKRWGDVQTLLINGRTVTPTPTANAIPAGDENGKLGSDWIGDIDGSLIYSGLRRVPSLSEPLGVVLVQTGGGAGVWDRVDLDGNPVFIPSGYFSSRTEYEVETMLIDSQSMAKIKKFHYSNVLLTAGPYEGKRARFINQIAFTGSAVHPAFLNTAGAELDQFYVGSFEAFEDTTKAGSQNNKTPLISISLTTMISMCAARNTGGVTGFSLINIYQLAAIQMLALIEMGAPDAQTILGRGNCDAPGGSAMLTGCTNAIWRAIHELWGNVYMGTQGVENRDGTLWIWNKNGNQTYVNTGVVLPSDGSVVDMSVSSGTGYDLGAVFLPASTSGVITDGSWSDNIWMVKDGTTKVCYHGGRWSNGETYGLFALSFISLSSYTGTHIGLRIAKV